MSTPALPSIKIDGKQLSLVNVQTHHIPGFDGWIRTSCNHDDLVVVFWHCGGATHLPVAIDAYNIRPFGDDHIHVAGLGGSKLLAPQSGVAWTSDPFIKWFSEDAQLMPAGAVQWFRDHRLQPDVFMTKDTGSGNLDFFCPPRKWIQWFGRHVDAVRFLDSYRRWQVLRPRQWRTDIGVPAGLSGGECEGWNPWEPNNLGLNGYDVQHFDVLELWAGAELLGWPMFLDQMIQVWSHAAANEWYWQMDEKNTWAGSMKTPSGILTGSAKLLEALKGLGPQYDVLRQYITEVGDWHLLKSIQRFPYPSPWYYGSCPLEYKQNEWDYFFYHEFCRLVWGVQDWFDATGNEAAKSHAHDILVWLNEHAWNPQTGEVFCCGTTEHERRYPAGLPGVGHWFLAPMIRHGGEFALCDYLYGKAHEWGWMHAGSYYGVENAAPLLAPNVAKQLSTTKETS